MSQIENNIVFFNTTIIKVLELINENSKQIAIVVDDNRKLLGTINDGDIRRALLKGSSLTDSIKNIYNRTPIIAFSYHSKEDIIELCTQNKVHQIPVVDSNKNLIRIETLEDLLYIPEKANKVVLMLGGLGTRLRPLTNDIPKPMLKVGDKPILETIVLNFKKYGFYKFIFSVSYKSHIIEEYFGDGSRFGIEIEYIHEEKRMGTAGSLFFMKEKLNEDFFVMNGDLLTDINFDDMYNYHIRNDTSCTLGVRKHSYKVPFGVLNINNSIVRSIDEKPVYDFFVSGGVYILNPVILNLVPENKFFDMPTLVEELISKKDNVKSYYIKDYWLDIGEIDEYKKANNEYEKIFLKKG